MALLIVANISLPGLLLKKRARTISHFARQIRFGDKRSIPPSFALDSVLGVIAFIGTATASIQSFKKSITSNYFSYGSIR